MDKLKERIELAQTICKLIEEIERLEKRIEKLEA